MTDKDPLSIGRGWLTDTLVFVGAVAGGGDVGPGRVYKQIGYDRSAAIRFFRDDRSGSRRSGSCAWQLEADCLYELNDIAVNSRRGGSFLLSTYGEPRLLEQDEFDAERARIWPLGAVEAEDAAERHRIAEEQRIEREVAEAERRRIEKEALAELNAEKAAEIAENGQPKEEGLPELKGTPKQIAYALTIRSAFSHRHPEDPTLKRATTAKYWIENHRNVLYGGQR